MKHQFFTKATSYFILGLVLVALFSGSCKKEDDIKNDYKISYKANGVLEEFIVEDVAGSFYEDVTATQYGLRFTARKQNFTIYLDIYDRHAITDSTYSGYKLTPPIGKKPTLIEGAEIAHNDGDTYTVYKTDKKNADVTISISEITKSTVRGSFKGTLKASGKPDMVITEGKYFVPVANPY